MKPYVMTAAAMLLCLASQGQEAGARKPVFGVNMGINHSDTRARNLDHINYRRFEVSNSYGFRMGLLMDWMLAKRFSFFPKAELVFNESKVTVVGRANETSIYEVYPITFEVAGHFAYRMTARQTTPYVLAGPAYKVLMTERLVQYATRHSALSFDFGIGLETRLPAFTVAPELRYSMGLTSYSDIPPVRHLGFHTVAFVVNMKR